MKARHHLVLAATAVIFTASCGGGTSSNNPAPPPSQTQVATPSITTSAAQNGAQVVTISDTTAGASIYYTLDGSTPSKSSAQYLAPFLLASDVTLKAIATQTGDTDSSIATQSFSFGIAPDTLVWSDEFSNLRGMNAQPNPAVWTYDTGNSGFGNNELETYCAWGSATTPCDANSPNAYVGNDGYLHIVARHPSNGVYTSARLRSQGLFSLEYGRIEARILIPEGQGLWPAFWLLGNNISTINWPACGEQDVMEHINAPVPDWVAGSIHGTNLNGSQTYPPTGQTFSAGSWHIYGMIWSKGTVAYYVDAPSNVYATFTKSGTATNGAVWPFDNGAAFVILNLAVGGNWPGSPDGTTIFPSEMLVDYVRVYAN
jgi:beta-glucanase (GH16 family)